MVDEGGGQMTDVRKLMTDDRMKVSGFRCQDKASIPILQTRY